jgi:hypothetical protein
MIAGSLSSCIAGFHQSCQSSPSSGPSRPRRISLLLSLEVALFRRPTEDRHQAARVDPADQYRKSAKTALAVGQSFTAANGVTVQVNALKKLDFRFTWRASSKFCSRVACSNSSMF